MGDLFGDVKALRAIWIVITTAKEFTKNRVVGLLDAFGLDVPACEIVLEDTEEALLRVVALFGTKEEVRKGHKVGDALEHAPGLEDKGGEGNAGQIHANSELGDEGSDDGTL